jgi:hypothetical protein
MQSRRIVALITLVSLFCTQAFADRPLILVTPAGVWQSTPTDGVPGPWVALNADVIVQGFGSGGDTGGGGGGDTGGGSDPAPTDPVVTAVATTAKQHLQTAQEAVAVASMISSVAGRTTPDKFAAAMQRAADIADGFLQASGRIEKFVQAALRITADPVVLRRGIESAFGLSSADLQRVTAAVASGRASDLPAAVQGDAASAVDFQQILQLIEFILDLLERLGLLS